MFIKDAIKFVGAFCASDVVEKAIKNTVRCSGKIDTVTTYIGAGVLSGMVYDKAYSYMDKTIDEVVDAISEMETGIKNGKESGRKDGHSNRKSGSSRKD